MINRVPAHVADILDIKLKDFYLKEADLFKRTELLIKSDFPTETLYDSKTDEVICICGLTYPWAGNLEVWTLMSKNVDKHAVSIVKSLRAMIDEYVEKLKAVRVQSVCPATLPNRDRWFKSLKLDPVALLRKYGPNGADYYMYERIV